MKNLDIVSEFCRILQENPEMTMEGVALRLSATDLELRLLKADPCREHYKARDAQQQFPFATGQGVKKLYDDDFHDY